MRHLPNLITALRFVLIPVLVLLLVERSSRPPSPCSLSRLPLSADGLIARHWTFRTCLGAIADPLADKLTMLAVTLVLASQALVPLWLATAIVVRDLVIVAGAVAFHFIVGRVEMAPSWLSKFNTVLEFCVLSGPAGGRRRRSRSRPSCRPAVRPRDRDRSSVGASTMSGPGAGGPPPPPPPPPPASTQICLPLDANAYALTGSAAACCGACSRSP